MLLETFQFFTGAFVVVYDGQHALKFTLGRAKCVVGPGIHFKWPIIQKFTVRETKDTSLDLESQVIQLSDHLVYEIQAKLIYQIVDLHKATIEVDELVTGLRNRLTLAIQRVVRQQNRESIQDSKAIAAAVLDELRPIEEQWGFKIHEFGFSDISPTPATLEITQLRLLSEEKLRLYQEFRDQALSAESSVSLISGAVMAVGERDRSAAREAAQADPKPASEPQVPTDEEDDLE